MKHVDIYFGHNEKQFEELEDVINKELSIHKYVEQVSRQDVTFSVLKLIQRWQN